MQVVLASKTSKCTVERRLPLQLQNHAVQITELIRREIYFWTFSHRCKMISIFCSFLHHLHGTAGIQSRTQWRSWGKMRNWSLRRVSWNAWLILQDVKYSRPCSACRFWSCLFASSAMPSWGTHHPVAGDHLLVDTHFAPRHVHLSVSTPCLWFLLAHESPPHPPSPPPHGCLSSSQLLVGLLYKNFAQAKINLQYYRDLKFDCCGNCSGFAAFKFSATIPC